MESLQVVLEVARKATEYMGKAKCPDGHTLRASIEPTGTTCGACNGATLLPEVVITRKGGSECGFVSCARKMGCAPRELIRVTTTLNIKHKPQQMQDAG